MMNDISSTIAQLVKNKLTPISILSEEAGVSALVIHRLITGELSDPKVSVLTKLAEYFDVRLGQLVGLEPL